MPFPTTELETANGPAVAVSPASRLADRFRSVRRLTTELARPLSAEDQTLQSMPETSPTKWHLAHTTWFFETFVLVPHRPGYRPANDRFVYLFNSYYQAVGPQFPRPQRGMLSRPSLEETLAYRRQVDAAIEEWLEEGGRAASEVLDLIELGLHHEQQHQELILTDIKHALSFNPLFPGYRPARRIAKPASSLQWVEFPGGIREVGHDGQGFAFDNETPRHEVLIHDFRLASRPVTWGEFLEFIEADGYQRPEFWLSDGWNWIQQSGQVQPLHLHRDGATWKQFTLAGMEPVDEGAPAVHLHFYEADAFARWKGFRLPTEMEWETGSAGYECEGHFLSLDKLHPEAADERGGLVQLFGDVWEWTSSAYLPYPGYRPVPGAIGEYNGKFMSNKMVLRGGSCVTPPGHIRRTYRNFFPPHLGWQFSGARLAADPG